MFYPGKCIRDIITIRRDSFCHGSAAKEEYGGNPCACLARMCNNPAEDWILRTAGNISLQDVHPPLLLQLNKSWEPKTAFFVWRCSFVWGMSLYMPGA
jgi:hypothetical protein